MKLILHIGGAKCGSSAIQQFLRRNAPQMHTHGILVPSTQLDLADDGDRGHQVWFFESVRSRADGPQHLFGRLKALSVYMEQNGLHTLLISAENLMNSGGFDAILKEAQKLFDLQIVAYIRRQDDYFTSAWQQWYLKTYPSFRAYLEDRVGKDANWAKMLEPWDRSFGRDRMVVRRFQASVLVNGDIVDDFLSITGLQQESYARQSALSNPSFDEHLGALAHRVKDLFSSEHDSGFFEDMRFAIGPKAFKGLKGSVLLTLEDRRQILAAYGECNRIVKEKYFPELGQNEPLFEEPSTKDVISLTEIEELRCQQDVLVRAIVGLAKRVRKLEKRQQPTLMSRLRQAFLR